MPPTSSQLPAPEPWPLPVAGFARDDLPQKLTELSSAHASWPSLVARGVDGATTKRPSAVMVLFVPGASPHDPASLLFTRRSTAVRSHKGQISFAGGRYDADDLSPAVTALRELHEEVGVPAEAVTIAGMLPPLGALDSAAIYPVVGLADVKLRDLRPSVAEVAAVFAEPWTCFTPARAQAFTFNIFGNWRNSWMFNTPSGTIWGLTAHILRSAALA